MFLQKVLSTKPVPMEMLDLGDGYGQNYGFILYRALIQAGKKIKFTAPATDRAQVQIWFILGGV